jgi:flagellar biosynthetic protein FliR
MEIWGLELWATFLAFARIGALIMLLPGIGDPLVPPRVRLALALMVAIAVRPEAPPQPPDFIAAGGMVIAEVAIGLMLGAVGRMLLAALATAGQIFGLETGLAFAQTADPTMNQSGQIISVFLSLLGTVLIFATDTHHLFLAGITNSYGLFTPGNLPNLGDAAELSLSALADGFRIGLQIAAPVVVAGLVFRVGLGIMSRLIPTIQVFFVAMPLNILGGFFILMIGLSAGMLVWLDRIQSFATTYQ